MATTGCPEKEYLKGMEEGTLTEAQIADYQVPGPFSFIGYLKYILEGSTWGDQGLLTLVSMMWPGDHYHSKCWRTYLKSRSDTRDPWIKSTWWSSWLRGVITWAHVSMIFVLFSLIQQSSVSSVQEQLIQCGYGSSQCENSCTECEPIFT